MRRSLRILTILSTGVIAIGLSGCADASDEGEAAPISSSASPAASPSSAPATDTDSETTDAAQCLHGTWVADNTYFLAALQEFGDVFDDVSGRVTLTFSSDGIVSTEYEDWLLSGSNDGIGVTISRTGVDAGAYSISGADIAIAQTDVGSTMIVTAAGTEMPIAPDPTIYSDATFTCDTAFATLTTSEGVIALTRA
jgi:hypothetical protein